MSPYPIYRVRLSTGAETGDTTPAVVLVIDTEDSIDTAWIGTGDPTADTETAIRQALDALGNPAAVLEPTAHEATPDEYGGTTLWVICRPPTPVGLAEVADRLSVSRQVADNWRTRNVLPEPRWTVGGRPAWAWHDIETWARQTGRLE